MTDDRRSGVFLHVTSLPGPGGVGTLGEGAREFLDLLERVGATRWQVCPLGPTTGIHGDSPYQSYSAFAGNPLLIDLDRLVVRGWLDHERVEDARPNSSQHRVDGDAVRADKHPLLRDAHEAFRERATGDERAAFDAFCEREAGWLDGYTLYVALKREFGGRPWTEWPEPARLRDSSALAAYREELADEVAYREFCQWVFDEQWSALRVDAHERDVEIIGDLPIYVGLDSADVWSSPEAFQLDAENRPTAVAGVPPDMGDDGQRWGNPLYDWDHLRETGFGWWHDRFERLYDLVDVVRIDHFKGFIDYWAIPVDADDPREGEWREAPGEELFATLDDAFGLRAIAEDLGHLTHDMDRLRWRFGMPGMAVPQYADWCAETHTYKPRDIDDDRVAYTSTHDTDTVRGWWESLDDRQRGCASYALETDGDEVEWAMLDAVWGSAAELAVTQVQDLQGLGSDARFNTPGTTTGNWDWRVTSEGLDSIDTDRLRALSERHGRLG